MVLMVLMLVSMEAVAQKDVTKFLGIPVDGLKPAMIQKLRSKGFQYNQRLDYMTGEFNGHNVKLGVVTNNNKVWRIAIQDATAQNETDIKIRFNRLIYQFNNNKKYISANLKDPTLSDSEDISYEMLINNKRYEASFYQLPTNMDTLSIQEALRTKLLEKYSVETLDNPTEEQKSEITYDVMMYMLDLYSKRSVWFMIDEEYGNYRILMFYDNEYNHSEGEDL